MITRIRNANLARLKKVYVKRTKLTKSIGEILKNEGFIESLEEDTSKDLLGINLKYKGTKEKPYINNLKRISRPGLKSYTKYRNIPNLLGGIGITIFVSRKFTKSILN